MKTFSVQVWPGSDLAVGRELVELLRSQGAEEAPPETAETVVVVLAEVGDQADSPVPVDDPRIIPVSIGAPSPLLGDRSQIIVGKDNLPDAANRITRLLQLGGDDHVALNLLRAEAHRWIDSGRPRGSLISGRRLDEAITTVARVAATGLGVDELQQFLAASRSSQRSARRTRTTILAIVACLLVASVGLALSMRWTATTAAKAAQEREAQSTSVRLAAQAEHLLDEEVDPDLPWLLAREALAAAPTQEAEFAARRVLASAPIHLSRELPSRGLKVAISGDANRLAVVMDDGGVQLFTTSLDLIRDLPTRSSESRVRTIALNHAGDCVAFDDGDKVIVACGESVREHDLAAAVQAIGYVPGGLLAVTSNAIWDLSGPTAQLLDLGPKLQPPFRDASFAKEVNRVAVASDSQSAILALPAGDVVATMSGSSNIAISVDGKTMLARDGRGHLAVVLEGSDPYAPLLPVAVQVFQGADLLVSPQASRICTTSHLGFGLSGCFSAHVGSTISAHGAPDGTVASVGLDGYLRVWRDVRAPTNTNRADFNVPVLSQEERALEALFLARTPGPNRLAFNEQEERLWVLDPATMIVGEFGTDLTPLGERLINRDRANFGGAALSEHGDALARWIRRPVPNPIFSCATLDDRRLQVSLSTESEMPDRPTVTAIAPDCSFVVLCDDGGCDYTTHGGTTRLSGGGSPVGISLTGDAEPRIYFADGSAQAFDGTAILGAGEAAVAVDSRDLVTVWATPSGELRVRRLDDDAVTVANFPPTWLPVRLAVSPHAHTVAVVSEERIVVVDIASGEIRFLAPGAAHPAGRHDVIDLERGAVVTVDETLGLRNEPMESLNQIRTMLEQKAPRELDIAERHEFSVEP